MKIHHNTLKKAKTHKIDLRVEDGEIVAYRGERRLASGMAGNVVLEVAIKLLAGDDAQDKPAKTTRKLRKARDEDEGAEDEVEEGLDDAEGEDGGEERSIVKRKYRQQYKPFKHTNGDDLAMQLKKYLTIEAEDGSDMIDIVLLKRFAQANECWDAKYGSLNPGQQRMNVGNRLRSKVRKGHDIRWVK